MEQAGFNPRAPCGARPWSLPLSATRRTFQSTRPVWGATSAMLSGGAVTSGFNPRAPCGARRILKSCWQCIQRFNPRAPCGARPLPRVFLPGRAGFNPRAPCGARRLRGGGGHNHRRFNPRAPCGARPLLDAIREMAVQFQSTRPVWGATVHTVC